MGYFKRAEFWHRTGDPQAHVKMTALNAAAEVLTALTGDAFFPGGMSDFRIRANDFLVFERGPSVDMSLQWATYRDAADQCSLSRIWGVSTRRRTTSPAV